MQMTLCQIDGMWPGTQLIKAVLFGLTMQWTTQFPLQSKPTCDALGRSGPFLQ